MNAITELTEYELRVQALALASEYRDSVHDTIKRAKDYATWLRDGIDQDRAAAEADKRQKIEETR